MRAMTIALLVLCVAGCGANAALPRGDAAVPLTSAAARLTATPVRDGYLRGDAKGLRLWGSDAWSLDIRAAGGAASIAATSENPSVLAVTAGRMRNHFVLRAGTVTVPGSACPTCKVVQPGLVYVKVVASDGKSTRTYRVPVTIAHKIIAISLNPLPNPSFGGEDAVLQYYDDNASPSVVWDDFSLHNATSFPNVTGLAFGADGSLYVANSGVAGYSFGTVTKYAPNTTRANPMKTFASSSLRSAAAVALDAQNNLYVADNGNETVTRFSAKGGAVTWQPGWEAGADVTGVAVDETRGALDIAMSGEGDYYPPHETHVGRLAALPLHFTSSSKPLLSIDSTAKNGVNEPYGVAIDGAGRAFVVNDYVSIVEGPPGPGPEYSTLTSYSGGIASGRSRPDATASKRLRWPLSVAADVLGIVYVADNTPPTASGASGTMWLVKYDGANIGKTLGRLNLSAGMDAAYAANYLNVEGIAVEPSPLRR